MALIGNAVRLHANPMYGVGGTNAQSSLRACWWRAGARRNFAIGSAKITNVTNRASVPEGYLPPYCWDLPQKSGGIASRYRAIGSGSVSFSNLAGGRNGVASVSGSGVISDANAMMLYFAFADLVGSGFPVPALTAIAEATASTVGAGSVGTAELLAAINASATLVGSGDLTAALALITSAVASLSGGGDIVAEVIGGIAATATLQASGEVSADIMGLFAAAASVTASGTISVGDLQALAHMVATATGTGGSTGELSASGELSAAVDVTGGQLTVASVATAVWEAVAEGAFTYADLVRILAAVSAGKTTIVDNGGGSTTVTFRDVGDTKDRVVADVVAKERTVIVLDTEL